MSGLCADYVALPEVQFIIAHWPLLLGMLVLAACLLYGIDFMDKGGRR